MVTFYDWEDDQNPRNGTEIATRAELEELLADLADRPPFFVELEEKGGTKLLVGVSAALGCAQFSSNDGKPPYLMALSDLGLDVGKSLDFFMAGAPTPVSSRYCLPIEVVKQIAGEFIDAGTRSGAVNWEAI